MEKKSQEERAKYIQAAWSKIVLRAWEDDAFRKQLLQYPTKVLRENGIDLGPRECKIFEENEREVCFILPKRPSGNLSESSLKKIAAAGIAGGGLTCCW